MPTSVLACDNKDNNRTDLKKGNILEHETRCHLGIFCHFENIPEAFHLATLCHSTPNTCVVTHMPMNPLQLFNVLFDESYNLKLTAAESVDGKVSNWNKINAGICFNYF